MPKKQSVHVICTSVGNDGFSSVLNAFRANPRITITGVDCDPEAPGFLLADNGVVVPKRTEPAALIKAIGALIKQNAINVLLPLSTEDQDFFAEHRQSIEQFGLIVLVATSSALRVANDKHELYRHCTKLGIPVPNHVFANTSEELISAIEQYTVRGQKCVIKLARGTGAQGVKIIDPLLSREQDFWNRLKTTVHPHDAFTYFSTNQLIQPIMVSDFLDGIHISVDAVRSLDGSFFGAVRTETKQLYGIAMSGKIIDAPLQLASSRHLAESIALTGAMNIEYRISLDGVPMLLEINPRFAGSIGHTLAAGLNLPLFLLNSTLKLDMPAMTVSIGCRMHRMWSILTS